MATNLLNEVKPDGALTKILPQLFDSYPAINKGHPASFALWSEDPEIIEVKVNKACHWDLRYTHPGWEQLVTAVPKSDEKSLAYIRMLMYGPFKGLADLISLEQVDGKYYLRCSDLAKWPANVLMNFCIASRLPIEYTSYLGRFVELVEKGFDPTLAFLLAYSTAGEKFEGDRDYPVANHLWIDCSSDWQNIIHGEMTGITPNFNEYPNGATPCNIIWGRSEDWKKLRTMSDEAISEFYNLEIKPLAPPPAKRGAAKKVNFANYIQQDMAAQQAMMQMNMNGFAAVQGGELVNPFLPAGGQPPAPPPQPVPNNIFDDDDDDDEDMEPDWFELEDIDNDF